MMEIIGLVVAIISVILIPMIQYIFRQNTRLTILEQKCEDGVKNFQDHKDNYKEQIGVLFDKMDLLHKDITNLTLELIQDQRIERRKP